MTMNRHLMSAWSAQVMSQVNRQERSKLMTTRRQLTVTLVYLALGLCLTAAAILLVANPGGKVFSARVVVGIILPLSGILAVLAGSLLLRWDAGDLPHNPPLFARRSGVLLLVEGITLVLASAAWYVVSESFPLAPFLVLLGGNAVFLVASVVAIRSNI